MSPPFFDNPSFLSWGYFFYRDAVFPAKAGRFAVFFVLKYNPPGIAVGEVTAPEGTKRNTRRLFYKAQLACFKKNPTLVKSDYKFYLDGLFQRTRTNKSGKWNCGSANACHSFFNIDHIVVASCF